MLDFEGMFGGLAQTPDFTVKVEAKFQEYAKERKIPEGSPAYDNHHTTYQAAAAAGAGILAEVIGGTFEKHPFLAKQAEKMLGGIDGQSD